MRINAMRTAHIILTTMAFVTACSRTDSAPNDVPRDAALARALQGSWCVTDDDGKTCWGYDTFLNNNTIQACGIIPETKKNFRATASFKVSGTTACYEVTESDDPLVFPVGHKFCAQVLVIDERLQRYKYLDTGDTFTTYRVPASTVRCPSDANPSS